MFRKKRDYDLIILGSGAGGSVGAHQAVAMGKKVAIFEKAEIGGECPNFGCVPTKALLHAAHLYENALIAPEFGIEVDKPKVDFNKIHKWKNLTVNRTGAAHGEESFQHEHIKLFKAKANFISPHEVEAEGKTYSAARFLIATGSTTFIPPIPGLEDAGFITYRQAIDFTKMPKSIFILGGGPIGCEFAEYFSTFGVKVVLADNLPRLIAREDEDISNLTQALFENKGIKVLTGVNVEKVEKKKSTKIVHIQGPEHHHKIEVDEILVATGKRPNLDFDPEKAGLKVDGGRIKVNQYLQTNVPHIFMAGDVVGPYLFTHTGYYQSDLAVRNAFSNYKTAQDLTVVPRCTFTSPEGASVGLAEYQAKENGQKIKVGRAAIAILGRANTSNQFDGFVKIITDKNERIIGGAIMAPRAGEMIHEVALAIKLKAKASDLANMIHAYPTYSEAIKIACSNLE